MGWGQFDFLVSGMFEGNVGRIVLMIDLLQVMSGISGMEVFFGDSNVEGWYLVQGFFFLFCVFRYLEFIVLVI